MPDEESFLELLDIYMTMVEKQDEIISRLSKIVVRQASDLEQFKIVHGFMDIDDADQKEVEETYQKIEEYKNSLEP